MCIHGTQILGLEVEYTYVLTRMINPLCMCRRGNYSVCVSVCYCFICPSVDQRYLHLLHTKVCTVQGFYDTPSAEVFVL